MATKRPLGGTVLGTGPLGPGVGVALAGAILTGVLTGTVGGPVFSKTIVYQVSAYVPVVAEVVTLDKHWRGVSQPTRRVVERQGPQASFYPVPIPMGVAGDATGFVTGRTGGPIFSRTIVYQTLAAVYFQPAAELVTIDKWFAEPEQPTLRRGLQTQQQRQAVLNPFPRPFTIGWHRPFSEPTRRTVARLAPPPSFYPVPIPAVVTPTFVSLPQSGPVFSRRLISQTLAYVGAPDAAAAPDFVSVPQAGPVFKRHLISQTLAYVRVNDAAAAGGDEYDWFLAPNQPTRRKGLETRLNPQPFYGSFVPITVTLTHGWFRPFSEPTRRVVTRLAPQPYFYPLPYPAIAGAGNEHNWFVEQNQPTRRKGLETRLNPQPFYGSFVPLTVTLTHGWFRPFSEPTRRIVTRQGQLPSFDPRPTVPFGWFRTLDEPTRRKLLRLQQYSYHPTPVIALDWVPLPNAPPARLVFPTRQQQYLAHIPRVAAGPGVRYDWFVPLETPVRVRLRLDTGSQQYLAFYPLPLPIDLRDVPICRFYVMPVRDNIFRVPAREDFEVAQRDNTAEPTSDDPHEVGTRNNITGVKC